MSNVQPEAQTGQEDEFHEFKNDIEDINFNILIKVTVIPNVSTWGFFFYVNVKRLQLCCFFYWSEDQIALCVKPELKGDLHRCYTL